MDKTKMILLAGSMALLALALILYPLISNAYYERHKVEIHTEYQEQVEQMDSSKLIEAKENAMAYNEVIKPVLENTDGYSIEAMEKASQNYEGQLSTYGKASGKRRFELRHFSASYCRKIPRRTEDGNKGKIPHGGSGLSCASQVSVRQGRLVC